MGQDSSFPKVHHTPEQSRLGRVLSSYSERYALQPRAVDRENPSVTGRQAHRQAVSGASSQENITTRRLFSVVWVRLGRDFPTSHRTPHPHRITGGSVGRVVGLQIVAKSMQKLIQLRK